MRPPPHRVGPFTDVGGLGSRSSAAGTTGITGTTGTATATATDVDGWRELLREHFVALDVAEPATDGRPFAAEVRSTLLGHLSAAEVYSPAQTCVRTGALARDGDAYLQVGLLEQGRAVVEQDGRQAVLQPGRFVVYETERPFTWHFPGRWRLLVLTWPRHLVDLDAGSSRAATARVLGADRLGDIVGRALAETVRQPPDAPYDEGDRLAGELAALVTMTLGARDGDELSGSAAADLRGQVASYVLDHLDDLELSVESIARAHFVSVRALHRAFAGAELTVGSLVRWLRLRLRYARQRLGDPRADHLTITDISRACGFADLPTFSHGFKQSFHESPSSYRRRIRPPRPG